MKKHQAGESFRLSAIFLLLIFSFSVFFQIPSGMPCKSPMIDATGTLHPLYPKNFLKVCGYFGGKLEKISKKFSENDADLFKSAVCREAGDMVKPTIFVEGHPL